MNTDPLTRLATSLFDLIDGTSDPLSLSALQRIAHELEAVVDSDLAKSLWGYAAMKRQGTGAEADECRESVLERLECGSPGEGAREFAKAKRIRDLLGK